MEKANGKKTGVVDLTRGELGTRGTPELRAEEAARAAAILQLDVRENLGMADGFFRNDEEHQRLLIRAIRKYRPEIVLGNALEDRHPDHGRAGHLITDACFLSGLRKMETVGRGGQGAGAVASQICFPLYPGPVYCSPALCMILPRFSKPNCSLSGPIRRSSFPAGIPPMSLRPISQVRSS
jgi:LmbE family N-acetylglucosaminyl deacetylase